MTYIDLPTNNTKGLSFYLALEEWVARNIDERQCFFMWQVEPTVIIGRNQDLYSEVNMDYCRDHFIRIFRRKSGGGCVYADMSNVMLSYITTSDEVQSTFKDYLSMLVGVLNSLGIKATWTEHNDVMIGNRKVSGNAFYHLSTVLGGKAVGRSIVHGTLLYDTNMQNMIASITPSDEKLVRHGVQSVRQRICLLKNFTTLSLDDIKKEIRQKLTDKTITLTPRQVMEVRDIETEYLSIDWISGHNPNH